jgi:hypothetical protein
MASVTVREITKFIEVHIPEFHGKRLESLAGLKLQKVLRRKNPYLYKAKFVTSAPELVKVILDAHLSSQEEAIFGGFLEGLAIFICERVFSGKKSSAEGIDLEFERDAIRYVVSIKSGPNWGNSGQIKKMRQNFSQAKRILGTNTSAKNIVAVPLWPPPVSTMMRAFAEKHGFETKAVPMKNTHHAEMSELLIGRNLDWVEDGGIFRQEATTAKAKGKKT